MPSIIIPAYNEEYSIKRTLLGVLSDATDDLEIVVVANACTDRTEEIARSLDPRVKVVSTDVPGKCNAINLGEEHLTSFPRIYLDADIHLAPGAVTELLALCGRPHPIVSPLPVYNMRNTSFPMRLFMRAESFNHYFGHGAPNGSGCFALTEEARQRWGRFPDIMADDAFVHGHFKPFEAITVREAVATVMPPRDIKAMIKVQGRVRRGIYELFQRYPELIENHESQVASSLRRMLIRPWEWPSLFIYAFVKIRERQLAKSSVKHKQNAWIRDDTTRQKF